MARTECRLIVAGTMLIGTTYGLARFAYGLFLPSMREEVGLSATLAGIIGSGAYVGYCLAIVLSALLVERFGPRRIAVTAALIAAVGMAGIAVSTQAIWLAGAVLLAGTSTGLASPPMAQAVSRAITAPRQGRANTVINAGTSLGVAVSGPVAFIATGQWRLAYAAFAVAALLNALLLLISVPRSCASDTAKASDGQVDGLWRPRALTLIVAATGMGMASAAFWTFSSEVVITLGHFEQATANIAWILIGVAGLVGGAAGDLIARLGLNTVHRGSLAAMAGALGLLVLSPSNLAAVFVSGALFGAAYIMLTGVYLVWGIRLYADRPAIGLGLPFLMIAVGQIVGSPLAGYLIGSRGYLVCFIAFALIAVATALIGYRTTERAAFQPASTSP
ncbi:MFS transporter [Chromohalobacter canadensis]|uniref:MFS transporter n=1 Tax=Chromohalobacter canadensis TaxID=141389 RepID=UPI0021BFB74E|nr:MFS transporter [Chromohalobacter canadensis]MCT8469023.1 MFS transporter [Chromohalobacter canadensis]MCT8472787.1 MFS transporter [Chromohalobacter canadensis]MCT8500239.1 MFS transporter [Chromohalobacter canadensis]